MKTLPGLTILLFWLALVASRGSAQSTESLSIDDFAFSMQITTAPDRAIQTAIIPISVYRNVVRADLGDLRVFNNKGVEVPHAVRTLDGNKRGEPAHVALPLFPLLAPKNGRSQGDLALEVERSQDGQVLNIRTKTSEPSTQSAVSTPIVGYILDASAIEGPIAGLDIVFGPTGDDYVVHLRVDQSDDLAKWRTVTADQTLIRLNYEDNQIEDHHIDLPNSRAKYFRLSWRDAALPAPIASIKAELRAETVPGERLSFRVSATSPTKPGAYVFDLGGPLPVDRVSVLLPNENTLIKAELSSSDQPSGERARVSTGRFYRIREDGQELSSPAIDIPRRTDRYWFIEVTEDSGTLGESLPQLVFEYFPDQLVFLAQGDAPYDLAYGSHKAKPTRFSPSDLLALVNQGSTELPRETALFAPETLRAGQAALTKPPRPAPVRTYVLWGILVFGVLMLGWMALRLAKSLR